MRITAGRSAPTATAAVAICLAACAGDGAADVGTDEDETDVTDGNGVTDAGPLPDAGMPSEPDASVPIDAGDDPTLPDGSIVVDADLPFPIVDSGNVIDTDAGVPDGGLPLTDAAVDMDPEQQLVFTYEFSDDAMGWEAGFSDYFPDMQEDMDWVGGFQAADETPDDVGAAFTLQGTNTSDDLFMFMKKRLTRDDGIIDSAVYDLSFEIAFYSNAPSGCVGIGGAPGESVYLKAGASAVEPEPVLVGDGGLEQVRLNVDKGNQSTGGEAAGVVGNVANGVACEEMPSGFVLVTKSYTLEEPVEASEDGELWLFVGTDSGFEGRTTLYYESIEVTAMGELGRPE